MPLVLIICGLPLAIGYWGMLPGDYRYLSEEVMAASISMTNELFVIKKTFVDGLS